MNDCLSLIVDLMIALGTITVAILAIWGNYWISILTPPKLKIVVQNIHGERTSLNNSKSSIPTIYYHLKIINERTWSPAKNCKVKLSAVEKNMMNGDVKKFSFNALPTFSWAPAELNGHNMDISHEQSFDFLRLIQGKDHIEPVLISFPNNFDGFVNREEKVKYTMVISADGYKSPAQTFEVYWNGKWDDDMNNMADNVQINELKY